MSRACLAGVLYPLLLTHSYSQISEAPTPDAEGETIQTLVSKALEYGDPRELVNFVGGDKDRASHAINALQANATQQHTPSTLLSLLMHPPIFNQAESLVVPAADYREKSPLRVKARQSFLELLNLYPSVAFQTEKPAEKRPRTYDPHQRSATYNPVAQALYSRVLDTNDPFIWQLLEKGTPEQLQQLRPTEFSYALSRAAKNGFSRPVMREWLKGYQAQNPSNSAAKQKITDQLLYDLTHIPYGTSEGNANNFFARLLPELLDSQVLTFDDLHLNTRAKGKYLDLDRRKWLLHSCLMSWAHHGKDPSDPLVAEALTRFEKLGGDRSVFFLEMLSAGKLNYLEYFFSGPQWRDRALSALAKANRERSQHYSTIYTLDTVHQHIPLELYLSDEGRPLRNWLRREGYPAPSLESLGLNSESVERSAISLGPWMPDEFSGHYATDTLERLKRGGRGNILAQDKTRQLVAQIEEDTVVDPPHAPSLWRRLVLGCKALLGR